MMATAPDTDDAQALAAEKVAVARYLTDLVDRSFGTTKTNALVSLLGVADRLNGALDRVSELIAGTIRGYIEYEPLPEPQLLSAFKVALEAEQGSDRPLTDQLLHDERFWEEPDRVSAVAEALPKLDPRRRRETRQRLGRAVETGSPDVLLGPLRTLPLADAEALLNESEGISPALVGELRRLVDEDAAENATSILASLHGAVGDREDDALNLRINLERLELEVSREPVYADARTRAEGLRSSGKTTDALARHALVALTQSPPDDWQFWGRHAPRVIDDGNMQIAVAAVRHILSALPNASSQAQKAAVRIASLLANSTSDIDDESAEILVTEVQSILGQNMWWADEESLARQAGIHTIARALARLEQVRHPIFDALFADLERAFPEPASPWTDSGSMGVSIFGSKLPAEYRERVVERLQSDQSLESIAARIGLLANLDAAPEKAAAEIIDEDIERLAGTDTTLAQAALASWIALSPPPDRLAAAISHLGHRRVRRVTEALAAWSADQSVQDRTKAVEALTEHVALPDRWIAAIATHELKDHALIAELFAEIKSASRAGKRRLLARRLLALAPKTPKGQRAAADVIKWLLDSPPKVNFEIAQIPIETLGSGHRSGERLAKAFERAAERHDETISKPVAERLESVGVHLHKKAVSKSAWSRLKALRKRVTGG
jgi:hypothetical protein